MKKKMVILATTNRHKVREISRRLKGYRILSLADFPDVPDIPETGATFRENAAIKALAVYRLLGRPVLADDSGLCVKALGGAPGVKSARYAGANSKQSGLIRKLLRNMKGKKDRRAFFATAMVYADSRGRLHSSYGRVSGRILDSARGRGGFGYDPVFYYQPYGRTFAEVSIKEKNLVSHRIRALEKIIPKIRSLDKAI